MHAPYCIPLAVPGLFLTKPAEAGILRAYPIGILHPLAVEFQGVNAHGLSGHGSLLHLAPQKQSPLRMVKGIKDAFSRTDSLNPPILTSFLILYALFIIAFYPSLGKPPLTGKKNSKGSGLCRRPVFVHKCRRQSYLFSFLFISARISSVTGYLRRISQDTMPRMPGTSPITTTNQVSMVGIAVSSPKKASVTESTS